MVAVVDTVAVAAVESAAAVPVSEVEAPLPWLRDRSSRPEWRAHVMGVALALAPPLASLVQPDGEQRSQSACVSPTGV